MLFKILRWVQVIISLILDAERDLDRGEGAEKKTRVMAGASSAAENLGLSGAEGSPSPEELAEFASEFVDSKVDELNRTRVFPSG